MADVVKRKNFIRESWDKLPPNYKAGIAIGGTALVGYGVYRVRKNIKDKKEAERQAKEMEKLTKQFNTKFVVTTGHGQGAVVNLDLASVASKLHDALNYGPFGAFTDDESILSLLLPIPKPYIPSLEFIYKRVYKGNLDALLSKGMWRYNYNKIRHLFQ